MLAIRSASLNALILEVLTDQTNLFCTQLLDKIHSAPKMFLDTGVILSLEKLTDQQEPINLNQIIDTLKNARLHILGIVAERSTDVQQITQLGLLRLPATRLNQKRIADTPIPQRRPMVVHSPVRAGQQIYAEGTDLIIAATVSAGAEVLADGHIHIYGPLRGRALAGIQGDDKAQIFCRQLEAELISVAGHYLIAESLSQHPLSQQSVRIFLHETQLLIEAL